MTKYAQDEFDQVPESADRQGVHRTIGAPVRPRLWPIMALGAAALVVGLIAFLILPRIGFAPATPPSSAASVSPGALPSESGGAEPSAEPSTTASTAPSGEQTPSAEPEPTDSAQAEPTEEPLAVDKTQPVAIYNAAGIGGLAGQIGAVVQNDGWQLATVANWTGVPQQGSAIFYSGPEQRVNAEALSTLLNIPTVVENAEFQVPVAVLLGPGYN